MICKNKKIVYLNIRYKVAHIHPKMGRLALLCSAYKQVSIHCKTNSKHKKYVTKMKKLIVILIISLSICIGEIFLLIHLFPQTGLARIVYIPFYVILMISLTITLFRIIKDKELKKQIIYWIIFHFLIFNFIIWSWPDDGKRVNIIGKFYDNLF